MKRSEVDELLEETGADEYTLEELFEDVPPIVINQNELMEMQRIVENGTDDDIWEYAYWAARSFYSEWACDDDAGKLGFYFIDKCIFPYQWERLVKHVKEQIQIEIKESNEYFEALND